MLYCITIIFDGFKHTDIKGVGVERPLPMGIARQQFLLSRDITWRNNGSSGHHVLSGEYWHSRGEIEIVM